MVSLYWSWHSRHTGHGIALIQALLAAEQGVDFITQSEFVLIDCNLMQGGTKWGGVASDFLWKG
jgi:hypothetical protein